MQENSIQSSHAAIPPQADLGRDSAAPFAAAKAGANKKEVPIVFCADENYGLYLPVAVQSIIENSSADYHYQIIIFDCGIKREAIDALQRQISQCENFSLIIENIADQLARYKFQGYRYITAAAYGRFFIPELCKRHEKVIYADIDMVFNRDPAELLDMDLDGCYLGGCVEFAAEADRVYKADDSQIPFAELALAESEFYINSGFLVFDIAAWRAHNLAEKCFQFCRETAGELLVQNAVNSVCRGKIKYLPPVWNFSIWDKKSIAEWRQKQPGGFVPHLEDFAREYDAGLRDGRIIAHFLGTEKPWHRPQVLFADIWWRYAVKTPFYTVYLAGLAQNQSASVAVETVKITLPRAKREVPIVFCADANYGRYLPVVVQSIIENSSTDYHYQIIVFDCGIGADIIDALRYRIRSFDNFSIHIKNIDFFLNRYKEIFAADRYLTAATYGRFAIPEICAGYDKVVYVDIDMVFNRDIAELMSIELGENYLGGVIDIFMAGECLFKKHQLDYVRNTLHLKTENYYVNAGLLLLNIKAWRKNNLTDQCIEFLENNKLRYLDQCAINSVCHDNIVYLDSVWNFSIGALSAIHHNAEAAARVPSSNLSALYAEHEINLHNKPVIHYVGPVKPWNTSDIPFGDLWWRYASKTEAYANYILGLMNIKIETVAHSSRSEQYSKYREVYSLLGIPIWNVKNVKNGKQYGIGSLRLAKTKRKVKNTYLYILGIKILSYKHKAF